MKAAPKCRRVKGSQTYYKNKRRSYPKPFFNNRAPSESTRAEEFYYSKQIQSNTSIVVRLQDGEDICGIIEWFDTDYLKIRRPEGSGIVIRKDNIKYIFKRMG